MRLVRRVLPAVLVLGATFTAGCATAQQDPSFRVNNRTGTVINEVYVSSSNVNSWGPDRLGANVLAPGQSLVVRLPQGQCVNDIRVVFSSGQAHERRRVDTCQITDYDLR